MAFLPPPSTAGSGHPSPLWGAQPAWAQSPEPLSVPLGSRSPHPSPAQPSSAWTQPPAGRSEAATWAFCPLRESELRQEPHTTGVGEGAREVRERLPSPTVSHQQSGRGPGATHTCGYPRAAVGLLSLVTKQEGQSFACLTTHPSPPLTWPACGLGGAMSGRREDAEAHPLHPETPSSSSRGLLPGLHTSIQEAWKGDPPWGEGGRPARTPSPGVKREPRPSSSSF